MGRLIPAGTRFEYYRNVRIPPDEPAGAANRALLIRAVAEASERARSARKAASHQAVL